MTVGRRRNKDYPVLAASLSDMNLPSSTVAFPLPVTQQDIGSDQPVEGHPNGLKIPAGIGASRARMKRCSPCGTPAFIRRHSLLPRTPQIAPRYKESALETVKPASRDVGTACQIETLKRSGNHTPRYGLMKSYHIQCCQPRGRYQRRSSIYSRIRQPLCGVKNILRVSRGCAAAAGAVY